MQNFGRQYGNEKRGSMSTESLTSEKRAKSLHMRSHEYATRNKNKAPDGWNSDEKGAYWWGLYEGFQAGAKAERRRKK